MDLASPIPADAPTGNVYDLSLPPVPTGDSADSRDRRQHRLTMILIVQTLGLCLFATAAVVVEVKNSTPWWTLIPAGLSAAGTIAAFTVTYGLFRRGQADRVRDQASRVYSFEVSTDRQEKGGGRVVARVHNRSDLPIWRVELRPLRSGKPFADNIHPKFPTIPPRQKHDFAWEPSGDWDGIDPHWELIFRDASDRRWRRVGNELTLIPDKRRRWHRRR